MEIKTKRRKSGKPKKGSDKFFDRDHSNDPVVLRKQELARKTLGDGSRLMEFLEKIEKNK